MGTQNTHTLILSSIVSPYVYNVYNIIRRMLQRLMTSTTTNIASVLYYILFFFFFFLKSPLLHSYNTEVPNLQVQEKKIIIIQEYIKPKLLTLAEEYNTKKSSVNPQWILWILAL